MLRHVSDTYGRYDVIRQLEVGLVLLNGIVFFKTVKDYSSHL